MSRRRRGPTAKARKRERSEAARHGFADLGDYRAWLAERDTSGFQRLQAWRQRQADQAGGA